MRKRAGVNRKQEVPGPPLILRSFIYATEKGQENTHRIQIIPNTTPPHTHTYLLATLFMETDTLNILDWFTLAEKESSIELIWGSDLPRNVINTVNKYIDDHNNMK